MVAHSRCAGWGEGWEVVVGDGGWVVGDGGWVWWVTEGEVVSYGLLLDS